MKNLITETDVAKLKKEGSNILLIGNNDILTPLAKDKAKSLGLKIIKKDPASKIESESGEITHSSKNKKIAIGSDHTGFRIKNILSKILSEKGFEVIDVGTYDEASCDYPDYALAVASKVKNGGHEFGIIIDASGIPSAITANKLPGIRAATCYNEFSARSAREHNNANILVVGAKAIGEETIKSILDAWLNTNFGGGRHQKRLDKIAAVEKQFLK
jgi:ribose 5-phosphate isomerase B